MLTLILSVLLAAQPAAEEETAYFAMGCFWCAEADFEKVAGVREVVSGYTGGDVANPTYRQVTGGGTGHYEAIRVIYDPRVVSYEDLLYHFWRNIDPYDARGQFCDKGPSYRSAIFVTTNEERRLAQASKQALQDREDQRFVTPILDFDTFYDAEAYHQDYYKSEDRILSRFGYVTKAYAYEGYREGCRRDERLRQVWDEEALGLNAKG